MLQFFPIKQHEIGTAKNHTVVQKCCKDDDESKWKWQKFDPAPSQTLKRLSPKVAQVIK